MHKGRFPKWKALGFIFAAGMLLYNILSLYFNYKYLGWYWEQVNNTVCFLFAGMLFWFDGDSDAAARTQANIRFLIHCIVLSSAANLVYSAFGYCRLLLCNNQFILYNYQEYSDEYRYYWIYSHKAEYALMLVAFLALFLAYGKLFKNLVTFVLSCAVLIACLYLTSSITGYMAAAAVVLGYIASRINWKKLRFRWWFVPIIAGLCAAGAAVLYLISKVRPLGSLNIRIPTWKRCLEIIAEHPEGWGMRFGESAIKISTGHLVNNAHNVFLNQILRFSIPVGVCFTLLFFGIVIYMLVKGRSFLIAGTWAALMLLLCMDYSMMSINMAMVLYVTYLVTKSTDIVRNSRLTDNGEGN